MKLLRSRLLVVAGLATIICGLFVGGTYYRSASLAHASAAPTAASQHMKIDCESNSRFCTEVLDSYKVFGNYKYVGHDEPSTLFYSNQPGSGNQMQYELKLPSDPAPTPLTRGKSFNFELHPAFWFGMAMCDTQSYPELLSTCTPDSDKNIVDPAISPKHSGTAFMEMQFYPPGWAPWPAGVSCDAKQWCAALNIDSLGLNPVTGKANNSACLSTVGEETVNFAFITLSGVPHAPANPVDATASTYTPNPKTDLFMNSGDEIITTLHDTSSGLRIVLNDLTSGQTGSMTASAANTFGQVKYDPNGTTCKNIPYDFHPMYSTSSEKTRVPWAAHSYNIAFADEIGHFDFCTSVNSSGACTGKEGITGDHEATDGDDAGCFPASSSTLVQVSGCIGTNTGFDGVPYQPLWPDGTSLHPTPIQYSSPLTGSNYTDQYSRMAFEADLPRIEGTCNRSTGVGCTLIPTTDDGISAAFYPFFSITSKGSEGCVWQIGNHIPGSTNDFGQNNEYGQLLTLSYTGTGGHPFTFIEDFRQILSHNPCQSGDLS